jgi:N-acetylglucosamine-6-phosphate deacetylase
VVVEADGSIRLRDSGLLAGSGIALKDAVARSVMLGGCSLGEAVAMATRNPGRFVKGRGLIEVGASADLIRFRWAGGDRSLAIADVLIQGELVSNERKRDSA